MTNQIKELISKQAEIIAKLQQEFTDDSGIETLQALEIAARSLITLAEAESRIWVALDRGRITREELAKRLPLEQQ